MPAFTAFVATPNGSRYLQQLCKHWGHRFAVAFDPAAGTIDFGEGKALALAAGAGGVRLTLTTEDAAAQPGMQKVVADHLLRFAFREDLAFDWQPA